MDYLLNGRATQRVTGTISGARNINERESLSRALLQGSMVQRTHKLR